MAAVELNALLADPQQAGAYYVDLEDRAALAQAATLLEYALVAIDFRDCRERDDALDRFAQALRFPDWFGGNWDALADCLSDLSWWPAPGYLLMLDHSDDWCAHAAHDCEVAIDILNEASARWAGQDIAFWAMLPRPAAAWLQDGPPPA